MNTTPDFDMIGQTVPLETAATVRVYAALRLCIVAVALCVCLLQGLQIGFWSAAGDRVLILLGLWAGLGLYGDGIEVAWRSVGPSGRRLIYGFSLVLLAGTVMAAGNRIWFTSSMVGVMLVLGALAYGLIQVLTNPLRALRFRQMTKYLRGLPGEKRRAMRDRLDRNFHSLIAEGFD
ncbi:hypothetical protein [Tritonibacter horizontis]|uniref:Uncharacterized protein n=1 Tax=Tritonibacter horizontis TaxID=1768241 RepID=A0A132BZU5_9RHOB|nr:hypothetical protein [Tritonibacter horizontis]KUP93377.1 hypothetical protein TRIHO_17180 [Tritonibacter horizontis]